MSERTKANVPPLLGSRKLLGDHQYVHLVQIKCNPSSTLKEITKAMHEHYGSSLNPAQVFVAIKRLSESGYLDVKQEKDQKYFTISPKGNDAIEKNRTFYIALSKFPPPASKEKLYGT